MIVVDTTVLLYAAGHEHPLREPCRRVLMAFANGRIELTTTVEVIQELAHVRARRRSRADAAMLARYYLDTFEVLVTRPEDLRVGLALFERVPTLGSFDAALAAVALNNHATALISADRAFGEIPNLNWIDPATAALEQLIGY